MKTKLPPYLTIALLISLSVNLIYGQTVGTSFNSTDGKMIYTVTGVGSPNTVSVRKNGTPTGSIIIPDLVINKSVTYSVTSIATTAFSGCSEITSVVIPNSITTIENGAFQNCSSLLTINIPNNVLTIGTHVFYGCSALLNITIPNSVTSIGNNAFSNCSSLTSVSLSENIKTIGEFLFYNCSSLTSIVIPDSIVSIEQCAFYNCSNLISFAMPNSVVSIGYSSFYSCTKLSSITFSSKLSSIENQSFSYCASLNSITLPNSIISIGKYAYYGCSELKSVTIPNSVVSIGDRAFYYCYKLDTVMVNNTDPSSILLGSGVFTFTSDTKSLYIPTGSKTLYQTAPQWCDFKNFYEKETTKLMTTMNDKNVHIYPSTVKDKLNISGINTESMLNICDIKGKILAKKILFNDGTIELNSLVRGIYIVNIVTKNRVYQHKFIKE